jgi:hypothetical protein
MVFTSNLSVISEIAKKKQLKNILVEIVLEDLADYFFAPRLLSNVMMSLCFSTAA